MRAILSRLLFSLVISAAWLAQADTRGEVLRVTDGDTIQLSVAGVRENVRLIGIDAPELHDNPRALRQSEWYDRNVADILRLGARSQATLQRLCPPGTEVTVRYDVERRDRYRRLLAYLFLPDGTFINQAMLEEGYAMLFTVPPNVAHVDALRASFHEAKRAHRGLWGEQ